MYRKNAVKETTGVAKNSIKRLSLRHTPTWHHPSINLVKPPEFSLVDHLVCLPLEEIYFEDIYFRPEHQQMAVVPDLAGRNGTVWDLFDPATWLYDYKSTKYINSDKFMKHWDFETNNFMLLSSTYGLVRAKGMLAVTSLNPKLALRNYALQTCTFGPFPELNAMRWTGRAQLDWSAEYRSAYKYYDNNGRNWTNDDVLMPRSFLPPVLDPVSSRRFLPDTLKRITIKRTHDVQHPSASWRSSPVVSGQLPAEWALFGNLETIDLSDEMGNGKIEGPIPTSWLMMTKLKTINMTGHPNFCRDWHRIVAFWMNRYADSNRGFSIPKRYYGEIVQKTKQYNISVVELTGYGWQWYDETSGEAGYVSVVAPDGKCCWDTFTSELRKRNYTLRGWNDRVDGPDDYFGVYYERQELCEQTVARVARPPRPPTSPRTPDVPAAPPFPIAQSSNASAPPHPPRLPPLPRASPLLPTAPPQPPLPPVQPGKWSGAWSWRPPYVLRPNGDATRPDKRASPSYKRWSPEPPAPLPPTPPPSPKPHAPKPPSPTASNISRSTSNPSPSPPVRSPKPVGSPSPSPAVDCSQSASQASFNIPFASQGPFLIQLFAPDASQTFCAVCGCSVDYSVMKRGVSALYTSSAATSTTGNGATSPQPGSSSSSKTAASLQSSSGSETAAEVAEAGGAGVTSPAPASTSGPGSGPGSTSLPPLEQLLTVGRRPEATTGKTSTLQALDMPAATVHASSVTFSTPSSSAATSVSSSSSVFSASRSSGSATANAAGAPPPASAAAGPAVSPVSNEAGSTPAGAAFTAAWQLNPASSGDYLIRVRVGGRDVLRWVVVDLEPPAVSGQLLVTNVTAPLAKPMAASDRSVVSAVRYLVATLTFSEPVRQANLQAVVQLGGSAQIARVQCFSSNTSAGSATSPADAAANSANAGASNITGATGHAAGAGDVRAFGSPRTAAAQSVATTTSSPPPPPSPAPLSPTSLEWLLPGGPDAPGIDATTLVAAAAAASGRSYMQYCVAVLYALEGSTPSITVPVGSIADLAGNPTNTSLTLSAQLPAVQQSIPAADRVAAPASAAVGGAFAAAAVTSASASFLSAGASALSGPGSSALLQSAFQVQFLALSGNLASPGISPAFRQVSNYLSWSVLGVKGNIPALDRAWNSTSAQVAVTNTETAAAQAAGSGGATAASGQLAPLLAGPQNASTSAGRRLVAESQSGAEGGRLLAGGLPAGLLEAGLPSSVMQHLAEPGAATSAEVGIALELAMNEDLTSVSEGRAFRAAAAERLLQEGGSTGAGLPPPSQQQPVSNDSVIVSVQDLTYTLVLAVCLLAALVVAHVVVIVVYKVFVGPELHPMLRFPRAEMVLAGLLLVAITFYATLSLGNPLVSAWKHTRLLAFLVLGLLVLPYCGLLWWLTLCRWYLEEMPCDVFMLSTKWSDAAGPARTPVDDTSPANVDANSDADSTPQWLRGLAAQGAEPSATANNACANAGRHSRPGSAGSAGTGENEVAVSPMVVPRQSVLEVPDVAAKAAEVSGASLAQLPPLVEVPQGEYNSPSSTRSTSGHPLSALPRSPASTPAAFDTTAAAVVITPKSALDRVFGPGGRTQSSSGTPAGSAPASPLRGLGLPLPPSHVIPIGVDTPNRSRSSGGGVSGAAGMSPHGPVAEGTEIDAATTAIHNGAFWDTPRSPRIPPASPAHAWAAPDDNSSNVARVYANDLVIPMMAREAAQGAKPPSRGGQQFCPPGGDSPQQRPPTSRNVHGSSGGGAIIAPATPERPLAGASLPAGDEPMQPVGESFEKAANQLAGMASYDTTAAKGAVVDQRLLALYPGKDLPMYRLQYRPDSPPQRLGITPPVHLLARFEFLFEDAVGMGPVQVGRETPSILSATALNFTHKALCAATFGAFGLQARSVAQLAVLTALQALMLIYLAVWRPFVECPLMTVEFVCNTLQMVLLSCSLALINAKPDNKAPTTWVMIVCFFGVVLTILLYELRRLYLFVTLVWRMWRQKKQQARRASGVVIEEMEGGRSRAGSTADPTPPPQAPPALASAPCSAPPTSPSATSVPRQS